MMIKRRLLTLAFALALLLAPHATAAPPATLTPSGSIPLEGVKGRVDHMAAEPANQRLYVAALGNNTVEVIDLKARKRIGSIAGLKKPQGVAVVADSHRLVVASGDDGRCCIYDDNQKLLGTLDGLDDADNVRYDPTSKLIYLGYGDGALAVIDPARIQKLADIKLEGHPESFQLETNGNRIFVNVPTAKHVAVIDRQKRAVVARWPLKGGTANFPMALDEPNHRLFVGCRNPARILVLDTDTGATVATLDAPGDADDLFYDPAAHRLYASGGDGHVTVIHQSDPTTYQPLASIPTAPGARTSYFDPTRRTLYVAVPHRGNQSCELRAFTAIDKP